jgi:hypothetical protein
MKTIEDTIEFIRRAHAGQVDKGGQPYWQHPVAVMHRLGPDASTDEKLVALLHDILEDTRCTSDDLLAMGYPDNVVFGRSSRLARSRSRIPDKSHSVSSTVSMVG